MYVLTIANQQYVFVLIKNKRKEDIQFQDQDFKKFIENISAFICPTCGTNHYLFGEGGGMRLVKDFQTDLLIKIPLDPIFQVREDEGVKKLLTYFLPIANKSLKNVSNDYLN